MAKLAPYKKGKHEKDTTAMLAVVIILALAAIAGLIAVSVESELKAENEPAEYVHEQIAYNVTALKRTKKDIVYIVIHDTDNTDKGANAQNHFIYFNTGNRKSSADIFVDENEILQINDFYNYYTWHCGDGGAESKIRNINSVAVEICVNKDGNYKKAVNHAVDITKQLMQELDVDIDHVVRHKDASGKDCPHSMSEKDWENFKKRLK